jgi:hypothetical protein
VVCKFHNPQVTEHSDGSDQFDQFPSTTTKQIFFKYLLNRLIPLTHIHEIKHRNRNVMNGRVQVTIHLIAYKINFKIPHYTLIEMSSVDNFIMHIRIS